MQWKDFRFGWIFSSYGGVNILIVLKDKIWILNIYLIDFVNEMKVIGDGKVIGRIFFDGFVIWLFGGLVQLFCNVNMYFFLFDIQVCIIIFIFWGYLLAEVILEFFDNIISVDLLFYIENGQWEMKKVILIFLDNGLRSLLL